MSSGRYLLDTTVVLALVRGRELGAHIESTYKVIDPAVVRKAPRQ